VKAQARERLRGAVVARERSWGLVLPPTERLRAPPFIGEPGGDSSAFFGSVVSGIKRNATPLKLISETHPLTNKMAMTLRSGRRYHPYIRAGTTKRSYRRSTPAAKPRRRRKQAGGLTNRSSFASGVGTFSGRKTSLRAYRNRLWNDTLFKAHWRSIFDITQPFVVTPNNVTNATLTLINALPVFWTVAAGLQQNDVGVTPPIFNGDIILRGGIGRITISNLPDLTGTSLDNCRVTVFAVWTTASPILPAGFPATPSTMWDPSVQPEFEKFGKVLFKRDVILKADGDSVQFDFKFKVQKIDQQVFLQTNRGSSLIWMLLVSQLSNSEAPGNIVETFQVQTSHNVSFSADAIGAS